MSIRWCVLVLLAVPGFAVAQRGEPPLVAPTDPLPIVHYDSKGRCARPRRQGIQPDSREVELGSDYPSCPPREPNLPAKSPTAIDGFVPENRFAPDSPLEGDGFELSVPRARNGSFWWKREDF